MNIQLHLTLNDAHAVFDTAGGKRYSLPLSLGDLSVSVGTPVTAVQIENLIEHIENVLGAYSAELSGGAEAVLRLASPDNALLAQAAFAAPDPESWTATREHIGRLFNHFADHIGRPGDVPQTPRFAALLVLVREITHHLDYPHIRILAAMPVDGAC